MARIAFIFAPYRHKRFAENLEVVDEDFGVFPPINLAYAAAVAEEAGHAVTIIDANALKIGIDETIRRVRAFAPDYAGFYFSTYMFHDTLAWAKAVKEALGIPILAGGINLGLYPRETMSHRTIDFGIQGDALHALPALLDALEADAEPSGIDGVCYRRGDEIILRPPSDSLPDFDDYPFPARHLLPNDRYYSITSQKRNFTIMMTSMGCPFNCSYCAIAHIPHRKRSAENVLLELETCIRRYGVREVDFFDADFPVDNSRLTAICEGILERNLSFEWSCRSRVTSVNEPLLALMAKAGCQKIYYGIETPNTSSLSIMRKNITPDDVRACLDATSRCGIRSLGFFMTGVPGETRSSLLQTIQYATQLNVDYAQFSRTIAKPCTDLDSELIRRTGKDFWRDYVLGKQPETRMPNPWTGLGEMEIEAWTKLAYYLYYYRPSYIVKALKRIRSGDELRRSVRTAARMLFKGLFFDK